MLKHDRSISTKIRRQVLISSVVAALAVCLAAIVCVLVMRLNVISTSQQMGKTAADDSKAALEHQMMDALYRLAINKATISDEQLEAVVRMVRVISENAAVIISSPDGFLPNPPSFPNPAYAGVTAAQLRLPEDVSFDSVADDIGLLGNLSPLLVSQHDTLDYVASVYIGSESGVSISADRDSDKKTNIFDPRTRGWYNAAKDAGALTWTDVFIDNSGRGLGITCAMPFYGANGELYGVAGAGMLLDILKDIVVEAKQGETGYAFIANERGDMIISDMMAIVDNEIVSRNLSDFVQRDVAERILSGSTGIERVSIDGTDYFIAYAGMSTLPWSLSVVMSVEEVISPALENEEHIISLTNETVSGIDRIIFITIAVFAGALVLTLAGNAMIAQRMAKNLSKPIIELSDGAEIIGAGNLDYRLNVKTGDEIESLSDAFNTMIDNIKRITAEQERIGAELDVATKIQASMLPCIFPPFPNRNEFDIYAGMKPAKEVGGDFYDFFFIDHNTLALVMADVSGKGVPAALFMVITKTLLKSYAQSASSDNNTTGFVSPGEVFEAVNNILCENNEADMFVTAFMGYLDIPTGTFTYVNAGHNPPLVKHSGGRYEWLKTKPCFVLAGME
ncbi:MAG: SpoIIE family protein phosphatase, partial [Oscillospiraceae bacterium]|nr:SpoIIE family protein phosphatase [Oscillospiraceae bacterium]